MEVTELMHGAVENAIRRQYLNASHKLGADGTTVVHIDGAKGPVRIQPFNQKIIITAEKIIDAAITLTHSDQRVLTESAVKILLCLQSYLDE